MSPAGVVHALAAFDALASHLLGGPAAKPPEVEDVSWWVGMFACKFWFTI